MDTLILLQDATATNSAPSLVTDGVDTKLAGMANNYLMEIASRAGSGTMTATIKLWGMTLTKTRAKGTIVCTDKANYVDGETMAVISDGLSSKTFEADVSGNGVTAGNIAVDISASTTAAQVAAVLLAAIHGEWDDLKVSATLDTATITLINRQDFVGDVGNVTITETVTNGGHTVSGMSGARSFRWYPLGTSSTASLKGVVNEQSAMGETGTDLIAHTEVKPGLRLFHRLYAEITAIGGTATSIDVTLTGIGGYGS